MRVVALAVATLAAAAFFLFLVNDHPPPVRTDIQPLDPGQVHFLLGQTQDADLFGKGMPRFRGNAGDLGGVDEDIALAEVGAGEGAGQVEGRFPW